MPVTGLPVAAEAVLSSLLSTQELSSWKVASENQTTVVVLRFKQDGGRPSIADDNSHGHWRRKPPAQIRRDQHRAQKRRLNGEHNVIMTLPPEDKQCVTSDVFVSPCATVSSCAPVSCSARGNHDDIPTDCLPTPVTFDLASSQATTLPNHEGLYSTKTTDSKADQNGVNMCVVVDENDAAIHGDTANTVDTEDKEDAFASLREAFAQDVRQVICDMFPPDSADRGVSLSASSPPSMQKSNSFHEPDLVEGNSVPAPGSCLRTTQEKEAKGDKSPIKSHREKRRWQPQRTVRK